VLAERGRSDEAIRFELVRRGVAEEFVHEAVSSLEPEDGRAARVARSLGGGPRAARALARRGFDAEAVHRAVGSIADEA
jgi:SOS response regulatory protein OraA/RecX